jgi:hypothetical protein
MNRRYLVFGLASLLALSLAVPALGGPSSPIASISGSAKKVAKKALRKANAAQATADTALGTANTANTKATQAQNAAGAAQTSADNALAAAQAAQTSADNANANANTRLRDTSTFTSAATANNGDSPKSVTATCPSGSVVTGGGYDIAGTDNDDEAVITESTYGDAWFVSAQEIQGSTPGNWTLTSRAICASP